MHMSFCVLMKKIWILIVIIIVIVVLFAFMYSTKLINNNSPKVCFEDKCFFVEVVDTPYERERGLMNRENLDSSEGMLFIFESSGNYPFWMKNTLIDLDIIWISESGKVVYIYDNAMPCETEPCPVINPVGNAKYVLEINGGLSSEMEIETGEDVNFVGIRGL